MTVIGQVLDTDTLCYKNNTVYQELIIKRINKKRIYFALSSIKKGEQVDVYKGYASISDYAYISSETDFTEDGSEDFTDESIDEPGQYGSDDTEAAG